MKKGLVKILGVALVSCGFLFGGCSGPVGSSYLEKLADLSRQHGGIKAYGLTNPDERGVRRRSVSMSDRKGYALDSDNPDPKLWGWYELPEPNSL